MSSTAGPELFGVYPPLRPGAAISLEPQSS